MFDFIVDHAIKNVWCTPDQDKQVIIQPKRITPDEGVTYSFDFVWNTLYVPNNGRWHFYQVGQLNPFIIGLLPNNNTWTSFDTICNLQSMICDIYTETGVSIPKCTSFYKYNNDKDIVIALKINSLIPYDYNNDAIYFRFYSNAYFKYTTNGSQTEKIYVESTLINSMGDLQIIQNNLSLYKEIYVNGPGVVMCYKNGLVTDTISALNTKIGDTVEFIYDSSIYKTVEFRLGDLGTFNSILDLKRKYLLHYAGVGNNNIDYQDDVDIFIIDNIAPTKVNGVYYHKNNADAVRMVTHKDYSIVPEYVAQYFPILNRFNNNQTVFNTDNLTVKINIRQGGYNRPLIFETNRIKELYKLNDANVHSAMLSLDSNVVNFRADTLENSNYTKLMRAFYRDITNEIVQNAYGYNSLSKLLGDTPKKTTLFSSKQTATVPYGLMYSCTVYEYDSLGALLGYYYHNSGSDYICVNSNAASVEMISGKGSNTLNEIYGSDDLPIPSNNSNYRVYRCVMLPSGPNYNWIDVTDTANYIVTNGRIKWAGTGLQYLMVRADDVFLTMDINVPVVDGDFKFTIMQFDPVTNASIIMQVPNGDLDVFLNNRLLVKNLDYVLRFPEIVINNKEYLNNPLGTFQKVHIRFAGFCNKDLSLTVESDVGFIQQGMLSANNKFDLRDDRVQHISVDGYLVHKADLIFSEEHSSVSITNELNGTPYQIKDIVVPLKGLTQDNTYVLRAESIIIDKATSDYLTLKLPQAPITVPTAIPNKYPVVSPFICKIIYDLKNNIIKDTEINTNYTDNDVVNLCAPYLPLLKFDQSRDENSIDSNFVEVHPHNLDNVIELSLFKYRFVERVVKLYSNNLVNLSAFLSITTF